MANRYRLQVHAKDTRRREKRHYIHAEGICTTRLLKPLSLDLARIVHIAHIHHLPAASPCNFLGVLLAHKRLVRGLDCVHLVSRAADPTGEVMDTGGTAHFVDQVLDTETEACRKLVRV